VTEPIIFLLRSLPIILELIVYKHFVPTGLRPLPASCFVTWTTATHLKEYYRLKRALAPRF
jgi:hypothetical protein